MSWKDFQRILFIQNFLIKGWEIGILLLLPILNLQGFISLFELGLLSTVLSISQFAFSFFSGHILNKLGNKRVMIISLLLGISSWILLSTSPNIWIMVLSYLCTGASSGLSETFSNTVMVKRNGKGKRAEGIGNLAMMGDMGRILFTVGTTIMVVYFGLIVFSLTNFLLGFIFLMVMIFVVGDIETEVAEIGNSEPKLTKLNLYFKEKDLMLAYAVSWLDSFSGASLFIFLPLLFAVKGLPYEESGLLSVLLFIGYMMGRKVLGKTADTIGTVKTLMIGETFMAMIILAIILTNNFVALMVLLLLLGVATRGTSPVCKALVADSMPDRLSIENGMAINQSGGRLAGIISRPVFSGVAGLWGVPFVFAISAMSALMINIPLKLKEK